MDREDVDEECLDNRTYIPQTEADELAAFVQRVVNSNGKDAKAVLERYKAIVRGLAKQLLDQIGKRKP